MEWSLTQNKLLAFHRLMRTDKPIGALLLLWPTLWALWVATPGVPQLWILAVFVAGVWLLRAAGCVVNDDADRKVDGQVQRTATRPLPSGAGTEPEADAESDDHARGECRAGAGVGVPVYEAVYPSTASGAGRGVWLVDSNGFCCCE